MPWVGEVGYYLIGSAQSKDMEELAKILKMWSTNTARQLNVLKTAMEHMASYMELEDQNYRKIEQMLIDS